MRREPGEDAPTPRQPLGIELRSAVEWVADTVAFDVRDVLPLAGDVSTRRYARLVGSRGSAILALYPSELASSCRRFVATGRLLETAGVRVPRPIAVDCARGRMLVEDLGTTTLYDERHAGWETLAPYLETAVGIAGRLAAIPPREVAALNPPLDEAALGRELEQTWKVALGDADLTRVGFPAALVAALAEMLSHLGRCPRAVAHRDLMARNLIPTSGPEDAELAVLDHQDLRLAPDVYDLASLLNDSLYPPLAVERGLLPDLLEGERARDYSRAAAQRCLKIVGTFLAFERRGDGRHRPLIGPSLERAAHHLAVLPEMRAASAAVDDLLAALAGARATD